jgi:hypothetical protein
VEDFKILLASAVTATITRAGLAARANSSAEYGVFP